MVLDPSPIKRAQFTRNPLKIVVAQLRMDTVFRLEQPDVLAVIQERLRDTYPVASRIQQTQLSVQLAPRPGVEPLVQQTAEQPGARFLSEDGAWIATVAPDVISLETTSYETWDVFQQRFGELLESVVAAVTLGSARRLGLRFVNELTHPDARTMADWRRLLDPELLGMGASERFANKVTRVAEQITFESKDDALTVRHSYTQNPERMDPPSIYLMDIDVFSTRAFAAGRDEVLDRLERYHDDVWALFRGSLTEEMVGFLNEEEVTR